MIVPTRRAVLSAAAVACFAPAITQAQEAGRKYRLALLSVVPRTPPHLAMFDQLKRDGFVEGNNLIVDRYTAALDAAALAAEFSKNKPDVVVAGGDTLAHVAQAATKTIPIVANSDDLPRGGLLKSFAHPEGNLTGVSMFGTELNGKRQEPLIDMIPGIKRLPRSLTRTPPDPIGWTR